VEKIILVSVARNLDSEVIITNYLDSDVTGASHSFTITNATRRITPVVGDIYSDPAVFHSFKLYMSTDSESKGLQPMFLGVYYIPEREFLK